MVSIAALTHRGILRPSNEDTIAINHTIVSGDMSLPLRENFNGNGRQVLMIADGMGGHANGALASRTILEVLAESAEELFDVNSCRDVIARANNALYDIMHENREIAGLGSTLVGAAVEKDRLLYFNVGDSRLYQFDGDKLSQLSSDDVPQSKEGEKRLTHAITQSLGGRFIRTRVEPHVGVIALHPEDTFVMCSDGLTEMLNDLDIEQILLRASSTDDIVQQLFDQAMARGATDNISIVVMRVT